MIYALAYALIGALSGAAVWWISDRNAAGAVTAAAVAALWPAAIFAGFAVAAFVFLAVMLETADEDRT